MKVLHVISDKNIGGAGVLLCTLLRNFDTLRVQSVVALPEGSDLKPRIEAYGVETVSLQAPCDRISTASIRELSSVIKRVNADIVHANAALCARIAGKHCGVTVLHTRHCCFPPSGIWRVSAIRALGGIWNRALSDRVIATADAAAQNLRAFGIPDEKIEVIINGSEPVREVGEEELFAFRRKWGIAENDFTVGICARLVACKGHETFLRAAKRMTETMPQVNFRFLIAGEGDRRDVLEELTDTLGIRESVRFLGFLSDTAPFYRSLRVHVNCSCGTETSCLALSESMSAGVPTVVSDYGGNADMIGDGQAGILYPVGDFEALAEAVCRIASDPSLEMTMRSAAHRRYREHYTAQQMTEQLTRVYEALI